MLLHSLHSKIFFLITATLIIVALVVMMASQRNVTRTIMTSEHRAIHNVLQLIEHDAASRWSAMLTHKVSTVLHGRHELKQTSKVIEATLNAYANLAKRGIITSTMAQRLARQWINQLELGDDRYRPLRRPTLLGRVGRHAEADRGASDQKDARKGLEETEHRSK